MLGDGGPRHQATLQALIEAGANLQLADRQGSTPLQLAQARGYREMVAMLEKAGEIAAVTTQFMRRRAGENPQARLYLPQEPGNRGRCAPARSRAPARSPLSGSRWTCGW